MNRRAHKNVNNTFATHVEKQYPRLSLSFNYFSPVISYFWTKFLSTLATTSSSSVRSFGKGDIKFRKKIRKQDFERSVFNSFDRWRKYDNLFRKRSKILGGGVWETVARMATRALSSFSATLADQRFQSRSIGTTRLGQPISVVSKGCCFAKLKHDHSPDRLPSIKLPLPSTKGGRCETIHSRVYFSRGKIEVEEGRKFISITNLYYIQNFIVGYLEESEQKCRERGNWHG